MGTEEVATVRPRGRWFGQRGDLRTLAFPPVSSATAEERQETIELLRQWVEQLAEDAIQWYTRDKKLKRTASKLIRAAAVILAVVGGIVPLQTAATSGHTSGLGYVLLAIAAGCMGFDYFFGVSSGWMRDITALQSVRRELTNFRLAWAARILQHASPTTDDEKRDAVTEQLALITDFASSIGLIMETETSDWLAEFRSSLRRLNDGADTLRTEK